jgi:hypothetical protein
MIVDKTRELVIKAKLYVLYNETPPVANGYYSAVSTTKDPENSFPIKLRLYSMVIFHQLIIKLALQDAPLLMVVLNLAKTILNIIFLRARKNNILQILLVLVFKL